MTDPLRTTQSSLCHWSFQGLQSTHIELGMSSQEGPAWLGLVGADEGLLFGGEPLWKSAALGGWLSDFPGVILTVPLSSNSCRGKRSG